MSNHTNDGRNDRQDSEQQGWHGVPCTGVTQDEGQDEGTVPAAAPTPKAEGVQCCYGGTCSSSAAVHATGARPFKSDRLDTFLMLERRTAKLLSITALLRKRS
jgi:hypothetical protein